MARFTTNYDETFTVPVSSQIACRYFGDVDRIAENLDGIEQIEKIDDATLRVVMTPLQRGPVTFRGEYRCRWHFPAENLLSWEPAGPGNVSVQGEARFTAVGPRETRIDFHQSVETEIDVNRLLATLATPIVNGETRGTVRRYLQRVRQSLAALTP